MRKYAIALMLLAVPACKKKPAEPADPVHEAMGSGSAATPPAPPETKLPPAGVAPPPYAVADANLLAPMWTASIKTLKGAPTNLEAYKGKAVMVVNVASQCGNTPQYSALEALQKKYGPKGFTVVGFPCNQFGDQEPGSPEEIQTFCSMTYGVTFPLMEKIDVNGPKQHEIYKVLTAIPDAHDRKGDIEWNFEKFVISADGTKVTRFSNKTKPDDPEVIAAVENALPKT